MPSPKHAVPITVASLFVVISTFWGLGIAWADKANKSEVDSIRRDLSEMQTAHARESTIQQNILSLLEKMDKRMERVEETQITTLREVIKNRDGVPMATPNPLSNPVGR